MRAESVLTDFLYAERLQRLQFSTLTNRRQKTDMVEIYKHIHVYDKDTKIPSTQDESDSRACFLACSKNTAKQTHFISLLDQHLEQFIWMRCRLIKCVSIQEEPRKYVGRSPLELQPVTINLDTNKERYLEGINVACEFVIL